MFRNAMPRYELLSEQALATLDGGWRRIVSEIGVEFMSELLPHDATLQSWT